MSGNELGSFLRAERTTRRLSLRAAADLIGVDHMRLSDIEKGINRATGNPTRPSAEMLQRIARAYQVPQEHLLELAGLRRIMPDDDDETRLLMAMFGELDRYHRRLIIGIVRSVHAESMGGERPSISES